MIRWFLTAPPKAKSPIKRYHELQELINELLEKQIFAFVSDLRLIDFTIHECWDSKDKLNEFIELQKWIRERIIEWEQGEINFECEKFESTFVEGYDEKCYCKTEAKKNISTLLGSLRDTCPQCVFAAIKVLKECMSTGHRRRYKELLDKYGD